MSYTVFTLTSVINFTSMTIALWLGLYIITRSPRKKSSLLTSITLWSFAGSFLNTLVFIHAPPESGGLPWWWGWSVAIAVPFGYHLSVSLLPSTVSKKRNWSVFLIYFVSLNIIAMETYTPLIYEKSPIEVPLAYDVFHPGSLFPLFGSFLVIVPALSLYNLWEGRRFTRTPILRQLFKLLISAMGLAILSAIYCAGSIWLNLRTPTWAGDLCLGASVTLLGYGIVRINALIEGRVMGKDFIYSLLGIILVIGLYLVAAFLSNQAFGVPFVAFIFIILLAVISHSLIDWGRGYLEKWVYRSRKHPELRSDLRDFSHTTTPDHDLKERLETLLNTLCQCLGVDRGLIALYEGHGFRLMVGAKEMFGGCDLNSASLLGEEVRILSAPPENPAQKESSLLVPLLAGGEQVGVIVLAIHPSREKFTEEEMILLEDFADTVASVIHSVCLQGGSIEQIRTLMQEVRERERELQYRMKGVLTSEDLHPYLDLQSEKEATSQVEDALRRLYDYAFLGEHPLSRLAVLASYLEIKNGGLITHIDRGKALQELFLACIEKLKPAGPMPSPTPREWHPYLILHECYAEGKLNREVMAALYVGEGTFNRTRRRAVRAITRMLAEMERDLHEGAVSI
jgi:hypothetical protein